MGLNNDNSTKFIEKDATIISNANQDINTTVNYLIDKAKNGKDKEKSAAQALLDALRRAQQLILSSTNGDGKENISNLKPDELQLEKKYQDFLKASNFSEIHTDKGISLTHAFRALSDEISYYKALEAQQYYSEIEQELEANRQEEKEIVDDVKAYIADVLDENFEIDDNLEENIDKAIEDLNKQIALDDAYLNDKKRSGYRLDTEAEQQDFIDRTLHTQDKLNIAEGRINEHEKKIDALDKEIERLDRAYNSPNYEKLDGLFAQNRKFSEEIHKLNQDKQKVADEINGPDFKAAAARRSQYLLDLKYYTESKSKEIFDNYVMLSEVVNHRKESVEQMVQASELSEDEIKRRSDVYHDTAVKFSQFMMDNQAFINKLSRGTDSINYFAGPDNQYEKDRVLIEEQLPVKRKEFDDIENKIKDIVSSRENNNSNISKIKNDLFVEGTDMKKEELSSMTIDDIKEKISSAKNKIEQQKDVLKKDSNYQELLQIRDDLKTDTTPKEAKEIIDEYKAVLERNAKNNKRLENLKALKAKSKTINDKVQNSNAKKIQTAVKAKNISSKQTVNELISQISNFEANIETLSRNNTHYNFDNEQDPKNKDFIKNNSKEFVNLRKIVHETQKIFLDTSKSIDEKLAALTAMKTSASDYMKARKAEFRPFQSSTRKFRMAYVQGIDDFCSDAIERLSIKIPQTQETIVNAFKENPNKAKSFKDFIHDQKEQITADFKTKLIAKQKQKQIEKQEQKHIEEAKNEQLEKLIEQNKLESIVKIFANENELKLIKDEDESWANSVSAVPEDNPYEDEPDMFADVVEMAKENERLAAEKAKQEKAKEEAMMKEIYSNMKNPPKQEEKKYLSRQGIIDELKNRIDSKLRTILGIKDSKINPIEEAKNYEMDKEHGFFYALKTTGGITKFEPSDLADYLYYKNALSTIENNPTYPENDMQSILDDKQMSKSIEAILTSPDFRDSMSRLQFKPTFDEFANELLDPIFRKANKQDLSVYSCQLEIIDRMDDLIPNKKNIYIGETPKQFVNPDQTELTKFMPEKDFRKYLVYNIMLNQAFEIGEKNLNLMLNPKYIEREVNLLENITKYEDIYTKIHNASYTQAFNKDSLNQVLNSFVKDSINKVQQKDLIKENQAKNINETEVIKDAEVNKETKEVLKM